ncbi:MAG: YXWGXW repeat-containing protein [Bryobacteraceae bacterium]
MFKKILLISVATGMLTIGLMAADVVVKIGPPAAVVETRPVSPGPGYVWTRGYHRWDGNAYVWTRGEWRQPPHEHAKWVDHRWEHRKDGYVFVEGHWK